MHSHNLLLDLALYNGIPLGLLLSAGLAWWLARVLRACRDADSLVPGVGLARSAGACSGRVPAALPVLPAARRADGGRVDVMTQAPGSRMREGAKSTLWVPALLMAGLLAWVGTEYLRAEEALRRLRFASARIGITMADLRTPDLLLLDGWKAYHDAATLKPRAGMPASDMALLRDTALRFPYPAALHRYAHALALNDDAAARRSCSRLQGLSRTCRCRCAKPGRNSRARGAVRGVEFPTARSDRPCTSGRNSEADPSTPLARADSDR